MLLISQFLDFTEPPPITGKPYPGVISADSINNDMVAAWIFNEGSGSIANDLTTFNNLGSFLGSPAWTTNNGIETDAPYLTLNGTTQYGVADPTDLPFAGDFTVFARMLIGTYPAFTGTSIFPQILACSDVNGSGLDGWNLYHIRPTETGGLNGQFGFIFKTPGRSWGSDFVSSGLSYTAPGWIDVCGVREGSTSKIYVNGVLGGTATTDTGAIEYGTDPLCGIGCKVGASSNPVLWKGGVDCGRIFSRALSGSEVSDLHANPLKGIV